MTSHRSEPDSFLNALTAQSKGRVPITQIAPRKENDALARAISYLGAVEVAPGRYAHYAVETRRYYIVTEDALLTLVARLDWAAQASDEREANVYSGWCADTLSTEMPAWWSPENQWAYKRVNRTELAEYDQGDRYPLQTSDASSFLDQKAYRTVRAALKPGDDYYIVTADLETGQESNV